MSNLICSRSNISAGQILSCDYTVHPRWLVDNSLSGDFAGVK